MSTVAELLFNLQGDAAPLLGGPVTLDQTRVHQQQAFEPVTGTVYATQVIANGVKLDDEDAPPADGVRDARGDLAISRVNADGQVTGVMYARGFDHGSGVSAENTDDTVYVWLAYDAEEKPVGSNAHGRRLVRLPFEDGRIVDVGADGLDVYTPVPDATAITPCLDAEHGHMGIAFSTGSGTRYRVFDLDAFRARDFSEPLYECARPSYPAFQGWTLYGRYVYQWHGTGYGDDNPPPPEGSGDAYFTVLDVRSGAVVQRVHDLHAQTLPFREPESVSVWPGSDGPQLVFGFATGDEGARQMALYGLSDSVDPDAGLTAQSVTEPDPGVRLAASLPDTTAVRRWVVYRAVQGLDQVLASGDRLSVEPTWFDAAPPACVPLTYRLVVQYDSGASQTHTAPPVTFTPPGGCGGGSGPVGDETNSLGCAQEYRAVIHWRASGEPFFELERISAVEWGRTINDISEASVTVPVAGASPECCQLLGRVRPWVHELSIYRDGDLVWQGPVVPPRFRRDSVIISAQDVFSWFDHLVNEFRVTYTAAEADERGRRRAPITYIAENHIRLNLVESSLSVPPDYPRIMDYLIRRDGDLPTIKVEKDGSDNVTVWNEYLGDILREWTKRGLTWTTVKRSLLLRGRPTSDTRATATLTLDHIMGDVEVVMDGTQGATYAFATSQQTQDISGGKTLATGRTGTAYGRLDTLVKVQEEDATDADLRNAARDALAGRYPVPVSVNIPDAASLSPTAPVTIRQLVPGERVDVFADDLCLPLRQGFALSDVSVSWSSEQGENAGERVQIGLIPLGDVEEELGP